MPGAATKGTNQFGMDIFHSRSASPMLLSEQKEPFDSPDYVYELKLDGIRCLAYVEANGINLRNMRNMALDQVYPELVMTRDRFRDLQIETIFDMENLTAYGCGDIINIQ